MRKRTKRKTTAKKVTLSRRVYDRLLQRLEDAEDSRDLQIAEVTSVARDYLPAELVSRMIAGEHPLRIWREHRGLTLAQLGGKAGMQAGYLSEIENGKKPGSIHAYQALAKVLRVTIEDILPAPKRTRRQRQLRTAA